MDVYLHEVVVVWVGHMLEPTFETENYGFYLIDLHEVVVGVCGESVPARVQPKRGSAWHREIKSHIGGLLRKVHYYKIAC